MFMVKPAGLPVCDSLYLLKLFCTETCVPRCQKNKVQAGIVILKEIIWRTQTGAWRSRL